MPLIRLRSALGGDLAVQAEGVFFAQTGVAPRQVRLAWDTGRDVLVEATLTSLRDALGQDFVEVIAVDGSPALVNRERVRAVIPNPDQPGACNLQGYERKLTVRGDLDAVLEILQA